jgi:hypothetical protein
MLCSDIDPASHTKISIPALYPPYQPERPRQKDKETKQLLQAQEKSNMQSPWIDNEQGKNN